MNNKSKRTDTAARIIKSPPLAVYRAFMDPKALVAWLPPKGMKGRIEAFDAREGGMYRMTLTYIGSDHPAGKTSDNQDVAQGEFIELIPGKRIVQRIVFESEDPAFAEAMIMTWNLEGVPGGTEVSIICENVPEGIRQDDHEAGMSSTLANLAAFLE
ncbi:SRPBCC family protein [Paenibacillus sp. VCA1]|uniref:SRPBCC family protein n=1 Tax=Paenibacillus sp. VCA1 TaxID=3039148 RepID=UPI0028729239|nr:SRPBCC family protein [Paenibacillus sp. VCA1]MDR9853882.1 SRPBCC family protein [Paenibacillus sp. VCA1]